VSGAGKTHILALIALAARGLAIHRAGLPRAVTVEYVFGPTLFSALHRDDRDLVSGWLHVDLLLVDDSCRLYGTDWNTNRWDEFVEMRHAEARTMVTTMNNNAILHDKRLARMKDRWEDSMEIIITEAESQRGRA